MAWAVYADVLAQIGTVDAERIAAGSGASSGGSPTFTEWWEARIAESEAFVRASLAGRGYTVPTDDADISANDLVLLRLATAEQARLIARPLTMRNGSGEDQPSDIGRYLGRLLDGSTRLDLEIELSIAFVPGPAAQASTPGYRVDRALTLTECD